MDENQLKQRIVGAIVLVALAVIFIPMLLSGDREEDLAIVESNIPPRPDNVERVRTLQIEPDQPLLPAEPPARTPVDEQTPATDSQPAADTKPEPESEPVTETPEAGNETPSSAADSKAWAVQVGSFSKQSNALGLRDRLRDSGYRAFVEKVSTGKGDVYRVRVGPEVSRSKAEALQKELEAKLKLKGLVVTHP